MIVPDAISRGRSTALITRQLPPASTDASAGCHESTPHQGPRSRHGRPRRLLIPPSDDDHSWVGSKRSNPWHSASSVSRTHERALVGTLMLGSRLPVADHGRADGLFWRRVRVFGGRGAGCWRRGAGSTGRGAERATRGALFPWTLFRLRRAKVLPKWSPGEQKSSPALLRRGLLLFRRRGALFRRGLLLLRRSPEEQSGVISALGAFGAACGGVGAQLLPPGAWVGSLPAFDAPLLALRALKISPSAAVPDSECPRRPCGSRRSGRAFGAAGSSS